MANNDGKIYITISDKRFGQNKAEADEQNKIDKQKEESKKNPLGDFVQHKFFNLIQSQARQTVDYTISNIGNFTGDYLQQEQVNNAMSIIGDTIDIANAAWAGAKIGGGWGALAGAAVAVAGKAYTKGLQIVAGYAENTRQNRQIAQLRTRAGLNSSNNGSRGTEY